MCNVDDGGVVVLDDVVGGVVVEDGVVVDDGVVLATCVVGRGDDTVLV